MKNLTLFRKLARRQGGAVLISMLVFIAIGAIILAPVLNYIGTGLISGRLFQDKADQIYTADAGIEDGLWQIRNDNLSTVLTSPSAYDRYDYATNWDYHLTTTERVNNYDVDILIGNEWIPYGLDEPDSADAKIAIEGQGGNPPKMIVSGQVTARVDNGDGTSRFTFQISLSYFPAAGDSLEVSSLGIWIPSGFSYIANSISLQDGSGSDYVPTGVTSYPHKGSAALVWGFNSVPFEDLKAVDNTKIPMVCKVTIQADGPTNRSLEAVSWLNTNTNLGGGLNYAWDADTSVYYINSTAGGTTTQIDAYAIQSKVRELSSSINGDYIAIGNSLMRDTDGDIYDRDTLDAESSATAAGIPQDALVEAAYLYWSGSFNNAETQLRVPTADGDTSGTWNTAPTWDDVDETSAVDTNYMTGTTDGGGYKLYTFPAFAIPAGAVINDLTIFMRAKDISSGPNNILQSIKVGGTRYNTVATSRNPSMSWQTYSYSYLINPATLLPWTVADINGSGSNPLQQFGVYSGDLYPDIRVSMVYAQVNYLIADTTATLKINGTQVYFDAGGNPTQGAGTLTADSSDVVVGLSQGGTFYVFYSSKKDVTALVRAYSTKAPDPSNNRPGNGVYSVGGVDADTNNELAFAGWSLIIIYSSPQTKGHQLYLFDTMFTSVQNSNVDFDHDGNPGGTISGFIVPPPVTGEVYAAKLTAFIGEGDDHYNGDDLVFNGTALWDGTEGESWTDVWNGQSVGMTAQGVDVDTFYVTWASNLLTPGTSSAQIDLNTDTDFWQVVYIIISFRSSVTSGGAITYLIH